MFLRGFSRLIRYNKPCTAIRTLTRTLPNKAKVFVESENLFAFSLLPKTVPSITWAPNAQALDDVQFGAILDKDFRSAKAAEIVATFKSVKDYCIQHEIPLSNTKFDKLVDGLMDQCRHLTDDEVMELLQILIELPPCDSYMSHNFHDAWSCLDDMCIERLNSWDIDKQLVVGDLWFKLSMGRICDYIFQLIGYVAKRADKLTKDQLIHMFFLINICRRKKISFEYEYALENKMHEMTVDDMAVASLGFFKSQSAVHVPTVLEHMLKTVQKKAKTIHEITLTAIIKAVRISKPGRLNPDILACLEVLTPEIERMSNMSALHIALLGTCVQSFHKKSLKAASDKLIKDIENIRLKDIERILNALTVFDYDPETTPDIYEACLKELETEQRLKEHVLYPRVLPSALHYLSLRNIYSYELMDRMLDLEFINESYGKGARRVPRSLFVLDRSIEIDCPDYKGNRLPAELRNKAAKWLTEFAPSYDQYKKISKADQLILDAIDQCALIAGDSSYLHVDHVLPHYAKGDIIMCKNIKTGQFVRPESLKNYTLGEIMRPLEDKDLIWYAIVILGWANTFRDSSLPLGQMVAKKRQLKAVGYEPVFVYWTEFINLNPEQKRMYIENKLS